MKSENGTILNNTMCCLRDFFNDSLYLDPKVRPPKLSWVGANLKINRLGVLVENFVKSYLALGADVY